MNKRQVLLVIAAISLQPLSVNAAPDLLTIYRQAVYSDPIFKQAYNQYMSTSEAVPQAMAALLPNIAGTGYYNRINSDTTNSASPLFGGSETYNQWNYTLTLNQPIFNIAAWITEKQATITRRQALATYNAAAQDLILRTAAAYFDVLKAEDNLTFSKSKKRANGRQLDQAQQRFKVGLDAITSVYEAQAAFDASTAEVISAQNNVTNQYEELRNLTNRTYRAISPLNRDQVPLVQPKPTNIDSWVSTALNQNYQLIAARFANDAARANIKVKNAGHLPVLSFSGTYAETNSNGDLAPFASDSTNASMGVNLSFPIFQGGLVESQTRQAVYDFQNIRQVYEQTYRATIVNTRISYNTIIDGISKIKADRQAVKSAQNSAESTEAQFKVGTRTMVDVVTAQQQLFQAQTTLANDQYNFIINLLQLKRLAGTLSADDLIKINHWLEGGKKYHAPAKKDHHI